MTAIEAMDRWGGGFVQALAEAWRRADPENRVKLHIAFPELFKEYERRAMRWEQEEEEEQ